MLAVAAGDQRDIVTQLQPAGQRERREEARNAREFTKRYKERYGIYPDNFASWAYDALNILALAMNTAKSTEPEAIRKAILAIKGYKGLEGNYEFDSRGDGLHGYNVVKNEGGKIVFIKRVDFPVE